MASGHEIADKLDEARALIEKGWVQRQSAVDASGASAFYEHACAFCAFGAVAAVTTNFESGVEDYAARNEMLGTLDGVVRDSIVTFNDAPERTRAEVIEAFRKAAELARREA